MTSAPTRESRQSVILEVLRSYPVQTQAQLTQELHRRRINATQATISRDLRQLRVARVSAADGPRYLPPSDGADAETRLASALGGQLTKLEVVGRMVVLHTHIGAAQVVAAAVDALALADVAGSVAGDDTIFVLARTGGGAKLVAQRLRQAHDMGARWG
jgi:transcriptional regulator of arginine metabolism